MEEISPVACHSGGGGGMMNVNEKKRSKSKTGLIVALEFLNRPCEGGMYSVLHLCVYYMCLCK